MAAPALILLAAGRSRCSRIRGLRYHLLLANEITLILFN
jgi:hypothetical protein